MYYHIVPDLKLIYAWSPKCACTTVKSAVLMALGHPISGNVHKDMLTKENLKSGKYGIYLLDAYTRKFDMNVQDYLKVCVIRNPYHRFVSAIRQRSRRLSKTKKFCGMTAAGYLEYMESNDFGEDHHFHPQTRNLRQFAFDRVLDISEMGVLFEILNLEYHGQKFGGHGTTYSEEESVLRAVSLLDLSKIKVFPEKIHSWLDDARVAKLRALYAGDFDFAQRHGCDYELPPKNINDVGR